MISEFIFELPASGKILQPLKRNKTIVYSSVQIDAPTPTDYYQNSERPFLASLLYPLHRTSGRAQKNYNLRLISG